MAPMHTLCSSKCSRITLCLAEPQLVVIISLPLHTLYYATDSFCRLRFCVLTTLKAKSQHSLTLEPSYTIQLLSVANPSMLDTAYLKWARKCEPGKEHVSFKNFVRKFDFTVKEAAHTAYSSLIESQHIRKSRQDHLRRAYSAFRARNDENFWAQLSLEAAERALRMNTAIAAMRSAIAVQNAGLRESSASFERYRPRSESNKEKEISYTVRRESEEPITENDTEDEDPVEMHDEVLGTHAKIGH